jgi:hypothetical protein
MGFRSDLVYIAKWRGLIITPAYWKRAKVIGIHQSQVTSTTDPLPSCAVEDSTLH